MVWIVVWLYSLLLSISIYLMLISPGIKYHRHLCSGLVYKVSGISLQEFNYPAAIYVALMHAQAELLADSLDLFTT